MKKFILPLLLAGLTIASCSKDENGDSGASGSNPDGAILVYPENNSDCTSGTSVSATDSKITFEWNAATNATGYYIYVKNLLTQNELQLNPGASTSQEVTLKKGVPYSWYIVSRGATANAESAHWKFYNTADAIVHHVPFPADVVAPAISSSVYGPSVTLSWQATDLDNDIVNYKVYFGTNANPTTLLGTTVQPQWNDVAVSTGLYYWQVDTTDSQGNVSHSPVFQFRVL